MVEFKDDGTATTPGKPRENRDAESAVVADLVAVELDDAGLNLNWRASMARSCCWTDSPHCRLW